MRKKRLNLGRLARPCRLVAIAIFTSIAVPRPAGADVQDLTRDFPLRVQDARPTDKGELQLQFSTRWDHTHESQDRATIEPNIQYGLTDNLQLQLQATYFAGDADLSGSGDIGVGALWRFLRDDGTRPSLAVSGLLIAPTGVASDGLDTELELDLTKGIGGDDNAAGRAHLNLVWDHNSARAPDERADRYAVILGYTHKLDEHTLVIADVLRQQQSSAGEDWNLAEVGVIRELSDHLELAGGIGAGFGEDSPKLSLTLAFQLSF